MLDRLRTQGSVEWGSAANISAAGLTPARGRRSGTLITWQDILRADYANEQFRIFDGESDKPALSLPCNARNFYPGLELFASFMDIEDEHDG
jgi:hypothetical protein